MGNLPEKKYYYLSEVISRWACSEKDVRYYIENGHIQGSVWLPSHSLEFGIYRENDAGKTYFHPYRKKTTQGIFGLTKNDCRKIFSDGEIKASFFKTGIKERYCRLPKDVSLLIKKQDIIISANEVIRFESEHNVEQQAKHPKVNHVFNIQCTPDELESVIHELPTKPERSVFNWCGSFFNKRKKSTTPSVIINNDFMEFIVHNERFTFGRTAANVVKMLYNAHTTDTPWLYGQRLLEDAGSGSMRMYDLFKKNPAWGRLIVSDQKGMYRLDLSLKGK